jgi:hypothetical protein
MESTSSNIYSIVTCFLFPAGRCLPSRHIATADSSDSILRLIRGDIEIYRKHGDLISILLFFLSKGSRLIEVIFEKQDEVVWTGCICLNLKSSGRLL